MKWLKRLGVAIAVLLVIAAAAGFWLLDTESGAQFALARAQAALDGTLVVAQARGTIGGSLELSGVRYRDSAAGLEVTVTRATVELAPWALFGKTLHLRNVDIDGLRVAMAAPTATAVPKPNAPETRFDPTPPLAILLDRLHLGQTEIVQDGKALFAADSLDLAAAWTHDGVYVKQLALRAPAGRIDLAGRLDSFTDYRGKSKLDFDWRVADQRIAGTLDLASDAKQASATLTLTQPTAAALTLSLVRGDAPVWTLALDVAPFDPHKMLKGSSLHNAAIGLKGTGDWTGGSLTGNLDIGAHHVVLDPLRFALSGRTLSLETLRLRSPEIAGTVTAQASIKLDATPPAADVALDWDGVELPADLFGQVLATHGTVHADGSAERFSVQAQLGIGPPGKLANIALKLDGTPEKIALAQLDLKQPRGGLGAHGEITLKPTLGWNIEANAERLDPGEFAADWPGAVSFALATSGTLTDAGPQAKLTLDKLAGTLRQRVISGNADLSFAPPMRVDGTLSLASGRSQVALRGRSGGATNATIDLAIASLGDWLPQAAGNLQGRFALSGDWPRIDVVGHLDGHTLAFADQKMARLALDLEVKDLSAPHGRLTLDAGDVEASGFALHTLKLSVEGDAGAHRLTLAVTGTPLGGELALSGSYQNEEWHGSLAQLSLQTPDQPEWKLQKATDIAYSTRSISLGELCLSAGAPTLCAAGRVMADASAQARFSLEHVPLPLLVKLAASSAPIRVEGELSGHGDFARTADNALSGGARIESASGSVAYPDNAEHPLLAYSKLAIDASLAPQHSELAATAALDHDGMLDMHVTLGESSGTGYPIGGVSKVTFGSLDFVELLTSDLATVKGRAEIELALAGSTTAPKIEGSAKLAQFAAEVPTAGLKLHDGEVTLHARDQGFSIAGTLGSGDGSVAINGAGEFAAGAPLNVTLKGERFLAADIPGARVVIAPDLTLTRDGSNYKLNGNVELSSANVDLSKLPGAGASKPSPDVVVTDAQRAPPGAALPLITDVSVKLGAGEKLDLDLRQGQEVHLLGFGLNGALAGQFLVQDLPGKVTSARGQIQVNGTYRAYGQDLTIQQGRLLFAGTPVDNPGLDIRATRALSDQSITVGLQVRGTAQLPELTVFSDPAMEQSDALSYLVAGKPLSQLGSGEGDMVGTAARALGTAGSDLLAKSIGGKMGLDDVGVSDNAALGGAALTVGKYLSPRLYISYGVGIFMPGEVVTLRYKLTRRFDVEMQNGTLESRAGINYKFEK